MPRASTGLKRMVCDAKDGDGDDVGENEGCNMARSIGKKVIIYSDYCIQQVSLEGEGQLCVLCPTLGDAMPMIEFE